jgi:hypothetical protein
MANYPKYTNEYYRSPLQYFKINLMKIIDELFIKLEIE